MKPCGAKSSFRFHLSFRTEKIDCFWSHSWHADAWKTYFLLLVIYNARPALIIGSLVLHRKLFNVFDVFDPILEGAIDNFEEADNHTLARSLFHKSEVLLRHSWPCSSAIWTSCCFIRGAFQSKGKSMTSALMA